MNKIGIMFGDNDFYFVFKAFFEHIIHGLDFEPTKKQIVELFNASGYGLYLAYQNKFKYGGKPEDKTRLQKYLQISEKSVYINETLEEYLKKTEWDNGEFFYSIDGKFNSL